MLYWGKVSGLYYLSFERKTNNIIRINIVNCLVKVLIRFQNTLLKNSNTFLVLTHQFDGGLQHLYNNATAFILQNGHLSDRFSIERGCRQGDPLFLVTYMDYVQLSLEF